MKKYVESIKPLCKNCEYWKNENNEDYGSCWSGKFEYENSLTTEEANDMLLYTDLEGYSASVTTGKNFGCVHFGRKGSDE